MATTLLISLLQSQALDPSALKVKSRASAEELLWELYDDEAKWDLVLMESHLGMKSGLTLQLLSVL